MERWPKALSTTRLRVLHVRWANAEGKLTRCVELVPKTAVEAQIAAADSNHAGSIFAKTTSSNGSNNTASSSQQAAAGT